MFRVKKAISLLLAVLCIAVMLVGCKITVPAKVSSQAQSELTSTVESDSLLSQLESDASSTASSSSAASASKAQSAGSKSVSKTDSSKFASSKPVASTAVSKAVSSSSSASVQNTPAPVDNKKYCTLMISCKIILNHMNELDPATKSIIPANGILYAKQKLEFKDGDSVFDVLKRERDAGRLKLEYQSTSVYDSAYIQSIGGLGRTLNESGWMYRVNNKFKNVGCSAVKVQNGDIIEWHYTCETGRDLNNLPPPGTMG